MKFIIGFLLLFAGLKAIGSVPYRFSESPWISESVADEGKYHMPGMKAKPKKYWSCGNPVRCAPVGRYDKT